MKKNKCRPFVLGSKNKLTACYGISTAKTQFLNLFTHVLAIVKTSAAHFDCTEVHLTVSGGSTDKAAAAAQFICKQGGL